MIDKKEIIEKLDKAKASHAEACERGNGLVAEYYEGVIDTLTDVFESLATADEQIAIVNNVYMEIIKDVSERQFNQSIKLLVLDAISESRDKIIKNFQKII